MDKDIMLSKIQYDLNRNLRLNIPPHTRNSKVMDDRCLFSKLIRMDYSSQEIITDLKKTILKDTYPTGNNGQIEKSNVLFHLLNPSIKIEELQKYTTDKGRLFNPDAWRTYAADIIENIDFEKSFKHFSDLIEVASEHNFENYNYSKDSNDTESINEWIVTHIKKMDNYKSFFEHELINEHERLAFIFFRSICVDKIFGECISSYLKYKEKNNNIITEMSMVLESDENKEFDIENNCLSSIPYEILPINGMFRIVNASSGYDMNALGPRGKAKSRTKITIWIPSENGDHYFSFEKIIDEVYVIRNHSNENILYLSIYSKSREDVRKGVNIHLTSHTAFGMNYFQFKKLNNGNHVIMYTEDNSLVLTAANTTNGSMIYLEKFTGSDLQQWKFVKPIINEVVDLDKNKNEILVEIPYETMPINEKFRIVNVASNYDMNVFCLRGQAQFSTKITLWYPSENGDHYFSFKKVTDEIYSIRSHSNEKMLYLNILSDMKENIKSGLDIHLESQTSSGRDHFKFKKLNNGSYIMMYTEDNSLVLTAANTTNGARVYLDTYTGLDFQQWKLVKPQFVGNMISKIAQIGRNTLKGK
jgi:hypothetical protein